MDYAEAANQWPVYDLESSTVTVTPPANCALALYWPGHDQVRSLYIFMMPEPTVGSDQEH